MEPQALDKTHLWLRATEGASPSGVADSNENALNQIACTLDFSRLGRKMNSRL
jgi:hypothetical protein